MAGLITERLAVHDAFTSACVGGGSVEIQIATARHLSYLCLADRNPAVRSFYRHGIDELSAPFYARLPFAVLRDRLNEAVAKVESGDASAEGELAVLFWAYSRRCNNGIIRVNLEGRFNVSEGLTAQGQPLTVSDFGPAAVRGAGQVEEGKADAYRAVPARFSARARAGCAAASGLERRCGTDAPKCQFRWPRAEAGW